MGDFFRDYVEQDLREQMLREMRDRLRGRPTTRDTVTISGQESDELLASYVREVERFASTAVGFALAHRQRIRLGVIGWTLAEVRRRCRLSGQSVVVRFAIEGGAVVADVRAFCPSTAGA